MLRSGVAAAVAVAAAAAVVLSAGGAAGAPAGDRITHLPGVEGKIPFDQYSGYVKLPADAHTLPGKPKQLFYWLAGSRSQTASKDPLVLWLNGGPGCSSMGGFMSENGPWRAGPGGQTLEARPYAWNANANVLFLDSPAGVGFSTYSPTFSDDATTAKDSYQFLLKWIHELFPEFKDNDFFITGESYAGHYIPTLTRQIVEGNAEGVNPQINLKGFMVGNPTTNLSTDFYYGTWRTWDAQGLVSVPTADAIASECLFTDGAKFLNPPAPCSTALANANTEMSSGLNPYDINVPVCLKTAGGRARQQVEHPVSFAAAAARGERKGAPFPYYPCEDSYAQAYLRRADVLKAIHVNASTVWSDCRDINYNYSNFEDSMLPLYESFKANTNLSIMVYSGAADTVVPLLGTRMWVDATNRQATKQPWTAWHTPDKQLAGYHVVYDRLHYVTVMRAGHMVPQTEPAAGFELFTKFITSQPLQ